MSTPPTNPCTDPRHTGPIRKQLGCVGPDPATPIEVGQTFRPTRYNKARLPDDRATVTRVWTPDGQSEQSIAYDISTVDHWTRPITTHSAMVESVFRKSYVLDAPEPESSAGIIARAVALLDSLDAVTYAIVTPDTTDTIDVNGRANGMNVAHGVEGLRSMADAIAIREAQRRAQAATAPGLLNLYARVAAVAAPQCPHDCLCRQAGADSLAEAPRDQDAEARATCAAEEDLAPHRATVDRAREQQRAKAKAQVLREAADDIESRNDACNVAGICSQCGTRTVEADRLRRQAAEIEAALRPDTCTCGVPTDPAAIHRTDAPCYVKDTDQ